MRGVLGRRALWPVCQIIHATSPVRGAVSSGLAEVVLEVSLAGPRPVIVSESSRVLRRGSGVSARATPDRNA